MSLSCQVNIGSNIAQVLDRQLAYTVTVVAVPGATVPLEIIISVIVIIFVLIVCVLMIVIVCLYLNFRRKSASIVVELVATE